VFSRVKGFNKLSLRVAAIALPVLLSACAAPQPGVQAQAPARESEPVQAPVPNITATSPTQDALIQAERQELEREDEQTRKARAEREKNLHLKLVQTMIEQDNSYAALAHLDAYDQKWGADRQSKQLRADSLRKTSQLDQAELVYKSLLSGQDQVKSGPIWYGLGKVAIERGDLRTAATRLEKSVQVDPLNIKAYSDLGLVYLLEGQKEPAYNTLMKANQLTNGDSNIMANLALWGLVYEDFNMAMDIADRLQWSDSTRNQVMSQANTIKKRLGAKGNEQ
jgi:Flp pilus assembly protein TadD